MKRKYLEYFLTFSEILTGFSRFELKGSGLIDTYYDFLNEKNSEFTKMLKKWKYIMEITDPLDIESQIEFNFMKDEQYEVFTKRIIILWYTGSWYDNNGSPYVLSEQTYREGLIWRAIGSQGMGIKPLGFGAWSNPPIGKGEVI